MKVKVTAGSSELALPPAASPDAAAPACAGPEPEEFARLFTQQAPRVMRALRRLGVREADVDDVCQEVFVVVHRRWQEFRGESTRATWVYGIALRKAMAHRRRKHVRDEVALAEGHLQSVPPQQQRGLEQAQARRTLQSLLERIDDRKREVFVLYELEQLPMKEIAALCEVPLHTAYSRLYAARDELAAHARRMRALEAGPGPGPTKEHP